MADEFERPRTRLAFTHERLEHRIANPLHRRASHLRGNFEPARDPVHAAELEAQGLSEAERRQAAPEREVWRNAGLAELIDQRAQLQKIREHNVDNAAALDAARSAPDPERALREVFKAHRRLMAEAGPVLRRDIPER